MSAREFGGRIVGDPEEAEERGGSGWGSDEQIGEDHIQIRDRGEIGITFSLHRLALPEGSLQR